VRLAVQQLLGTSPVCDHPPQTSQRVAEKLAIRVRKLGSELATAYQLLSLRDSIREVRRRKIDFPHASVQPREHLRVLGWRDVSRRHRLIVGPQCDREAVTLVDARLHPRLKRSHRAIGFGQPLSKVYFELRNFLSYVCHASKDVTGQQAQREFVRVVKNDRVIDSQVKRLSARPSGSYRTRNI
jgi:hypothetical protein